MAGTGNFVTNKQLYDELTAVRSSLTQVKIASGISSLGVGVLFLKVFGASPPVINTAELITRLVAA